MRKPLGVVAVVLGAVLLLSGAAVALFDANQFHESIRAQLEKRLGRGVAIGGLGLKLFPLSIRLDDVTVAESPRFAPNQRFASVKEVAVRVGLAGLLKKQVNVESLRLTKPEVELIRNAAGEWNAASLGGSSSGQGGLSIANLRIEDGRLAITDYQQKRSRTVYPHIDVGLRDFAPGKRFDADMELRFAESGKQRLIARASGSRSDLDGSASLESVSLPALLAFFGSASAGVPETTLNGRAKFQRRASKVTGSGAFEAAEKRLKAPAQIEFEVAGDLDAGLWSVPSARLKVDSLTATARGEMRVKADPARIEAELRADNASVAALLQLAAAFGASADVTGIGTVSFTAKVDGPLRDPAIAGSGTLRDAKLSTPSLRQPLEIQAAGIRFDKESARFENVTAALGAMHASGSASARNFANPRIEFKADVDKIDGNEIQQLVASAPSDGKGNSKPLSGGGTLHVGTLTYDRIAMTDVRATVAFDNGVVRLDPISAQLFGGNQAGAIAVDTRGGQNAFEVRSRLTKVDANRLLSTATSVRQIFFGALSGDIDVKAVPHAGQELASALNGTARLQVTDGRLVGVQLLNELAGVAKFLGYAKRNEAFTNIIKLAGTMRFQDGVANTDDLALEFDGGSLAAAGSFGLVDQQLKLRLTTILARELSQRAGGSQAAGLMSTVLSNAKGELVIPALVTGTFAQPRFLPDPSRIARMKLEGLLPTRDNPNAAASRIQGILGTLTGAKPASEPQAAEPGAQPAKKKSIFDIIDSVRKKTERN